MKKILGFLKPKADQNYTPVGKLHQAPSEDRRDTMQHLLSSRKYSIDLTDRKHRTPLHFASAYGQADAVSFLVQRKCETEIFDSDGCTALIKAAQNQNVECIITLLENGSIVNIGDHKGMTALHYAAQNNDRSIAEILITHHASMESKDKKGQTPLMLAARQNHKEMVKFLIENKANIHAVDRHGRTSLMLAVKCEAVDVVYILLQEGMDIFTQDKSGRNMLDFASHCSFKVKKEILNYFKNKPENVYTGEPEPTMGLAMPEEQERPRDTVSKQPQNVLQRNKSKLPENFQSSRPNDAKYVGRSEGGVTSPDTCASHLEPPGSQSPAEAQHLPSPSSSLAVPKMIEFMDKPSITDMPSIAKHSELSNQYLTETFSQTKDEDFVLQGELPEIEEQKSMSQHENTAWKQEISKLRCALQEEERTACRFRDEMEAYLKERDQQYEEAVQRRKKQEACIRILAKELKTVKEKVTMSCEEKDQLQELCTLQKEMAMKRKEIVTMKIEDMKREKKFFGEIEILKKENEDLQRAIQLKDEKFAKESSQYKTMINSFIEENMKLSAQLDKRL